MRRAPGTLTPRELEALTLIADGCTMRQTAQAMGIAWVTVRIHLSRARDVLEATTTAHAVAVAIRKGMIL
jgi:DNA-binding CsgD family transcriptional regulator